MSFLVVFIKKRSFQSSEEQLQCLKAVSHANITHLRKVFISGESIYFVYEAMCTSLAQLHGSPHTRFNEADIATVCKKVLHGLSYIHEHLRISHGFLNCDNVLLGDNGKIQIANIGESLLNTIADLASKQRDVRSVGLIAVKLKKRHTGLDDSNTLMLQEPRNASAEVRGFIQQSSVISSHELLQV
ncbi:hypothetical protein ACJ72_07333 [Emergomyces africanus]|uniref:Protein kinase domain-containing protein n=1 Tax=Emergomyces africanus TaxID=1955775 RepID=A0A1B7NNG5_9EURO|nr:hypothetical protein ACJ72_07333 [Emergomyces africanus]